MADILYITWGIAIARAQRGAPQELASLVAKYEIPVDYRAGVAKLLKNPPRPARRSTRRLSETQCCWVRDTFRILSDPKITAPEKYTNEQIRDWLATRLKVSAETVRDVVEFKKTYARGNGEKRSARSPPKG